MVKIIPVLQGRDAWPNSGVGGTLDLTGLKPGPYYRAPAKGSTMDMPGHTAARAIASGGECTLNEYAVYMAVSAFQPYFGATVDGVLGPKTEAAIKAYQIAKALVPDGVLGPKTSKSLFSPIVFEMIGPARPALAVVCSGHIAVESGYDPGAIGKATPDDKGLAQINGPSHPGVSLDFALTPRAAIQWMIAFVEANVKAMGGNVRDGIAAYNLGVGGAKAWVDAGRPDSYSRIYSGVIYVTEVKQYIDRVMAAGE